MCAVAADMLQIRAHQVKIRTGRRRMASTAGTRDLASEAERCAPPSAQRVLPPCSGGRLCAATLTHARKLSIGAMDGGRGGRRAPY
jgi:hypothetical protein